MPYIPDIRDYKPFYIQTDSDATAIDTAAQWGLVAKSNPYPILPTPKETYSNDFKDEDGEDDYTDAIAYSPITFSVSFYVKTVDVPPTLAADLLRSQIQSFFTKIKRGEFRVYDAYTHIGRKNVRYTGAEEDSFREENGVAVCIFKVNFKCNAPTVLMTLTDNVIAEV